jgi:2-acylglycerol O-acyltransferase 2
VTYFEEGSLGARIQKKLKSMFSFSMPVFHGRGVFFKSLPAFMPFRRPITVVVGSPIKVPKVDCNKVDLRKSEEGRAIVDKVHKQYMQGLREVWDSHKNRILAGINRTSSLRFS